MPPPSPDLQAALDRGALVLAPTALAAGSLRAAHDARRRSVGQATWQPANVLSWQQWLGGLWSGLILDGSETRLLLNPAQEGSLWRDIIVRSLDPANRGSAPGFSALASSAFSLANAYNINTRLAAASHTEDTAQFASWAAEFARTCGRHDYLPAARLPAALLEHLAHARLIPPAELHLTGFLELSPMDADFLEALRRAGTWIVEHPRPPVPPGTRAVLRARTEAEELRAAAHWLRSFLDQHLAGHPGEDLPPVHVVLANPSFDTAALDSIFREVLAPELNLITTDATSAPWEHAAGLPLASQPVIASLVLLLQGVIRALTPDEVTALLLSPFLGTRHDRDAAAQFDAYALRDHPPLRPEVTFRDLHRSAQQSPFGQTTLGWLHPLLSSLRDAGDLAASRTHAAWTIFIRDLAATVSWPGSRALTAAELAATSAWEHLLDRVATLDFTGRRVPFTEALAAVGHQFSSAAVSLPTHAPIRILSVTEAAATPADVLLLLQATDTNWPPVTRPHPLLPWHLQASAAMPGAHPARDAERLQRLTHALLGSTPHVLLSYAAETAGAPARFAPALAQSSKTASWLELQAAELLPASVPLVTLEHLVDDAPLPPLASPHVPGGATVLQLQAACGFRAFAEIRLRSTEPRSSEFGIDAGRAGSLLHGALDAFWSRIRSQGALLDLPSEECDEQLTAAIQQTFSRFSAFSHTDDPWDRAYRALQMERLFHLLKEWLGYERSRAPFTVLNREQDRQITVGPLQLQLRIDRIDQVNSQDDDSSKVLIDYKTGADVRTSAWETERPDQPQLPLYTLLPDAAQLRGLAFARVRAGEFGWIGLQDAPALLGKARLEPDLESLVAEWRRVLTQLAEQFAAGDHSVNPKSYPSTCTHCGQRFLCRLDPDMLLAAEAAEEADSEEEVTYG